MIIQTTIFDKPAYDAGLREAMRMVIDEFALTYPGIKNVEHEDFYAVHGADKATREGRPGQRRTRWLANRSSFIKEGAHRRAFGAMVGNLRVDYERRLVDLTGIEPVTS